MDRFSKFTFTLIYLLIIKSSLYNIEQNSKIEVTHMYNFTGIT